MRSALRHFPICLLLGVAALSCSKGSDNVQILQADLSGANEVPARNTGATGTAGITIEGQTVHFTVEVHNINAVSLSHIHSGAAGVNGPVRVNFFTGPVTGPVNGILAQGSFTAADVKGVSFDELLAEMRSGTAYVNVHSPTFPAGEIRGQIRVVAQ
jgi:hypothetical protein